MSIKFKWSVTKLTVSQDNLVIKVDLMVNGTDGNNMASAAYFRDLVRGDGFIPFEQLTEEQVLAWCFEPIVTNTIDLFDNTITTVTKLLKDDGEEQVADQISRQLSQKISEPNLPWVKI